METPLLYRQLQDQLRQWIAPKDQRHLQGFFDLYTGAQDTAYQAPFKRLVQMDTDRYS